MEEHDSEQGWPAAKVHRRYRPPGLARTARELCKAKGCTSRERVRRSPFCRKHWREYAEMMAAPASLRPLFSTWV